ncbi:stalk domain-containing protein [Paenibacillus sp. J2TS4]|uniref:stalk domain-containing protein n=1 Tax=Paenibacillus sp. J2TS4 TaxID=2807194 RepID=UPI001B1B9DD1|nr:phosphodiester glycosidase family protein [Paenibacillus sp. J2TS4]GIP35490.1 hypothetical protein J2TS4_47000 [Paenibacillus sp. J2TS4]
MKRYNKHRFLWRMMGWMVFGCLFLTCSVQAAADHSVVYSEKNISYGGKVFTIQYIEVDIKDPALKIKPVIAQGGIGQVEDFQAMIERNGAVAAVNGTFFNAYEKDPGIRYPNGLLIADGQVIHSGKNQSLAIDLNKEAVIEQWDMTLRAHVVQGGIQEDNQDYTFTVWGVNKYFGIEAIDQVIVYTSDFGHKSIAFPNGSKVVVKNGIITEITEKEVQIPEDGFVIFVGRAEGNIRYLLPNLHVGDKVKLQSTILNVDTQKRSNAAEWLSAIGVGPKLLTAGQVDVDGERDGFTDPKITKSAAARSFVGINQEGKLVMGTTSAATMPQLAGVLLELGVTDAMNMDGGASAALYADGKVVRPAGRLLSNAWIVQKLDKPEVQIFVNGQYVHEYQGFIDGETTMAPFRGIFERMDAEFEWDNETRTLSARKDEIALKLYPDQLTAYVNEEPIILDRAPVILEGHIYIPLRFVVQTLGASVEWDQELYRASITVP